MQQTFKWFSFSILIHSTDPFPLNNCSVVPKLFDMFSDDIAQSVPSVPYVKLPDTAALSGSSYNLRD